MVTTKRPYCHELVLKGGPKPSSCPFFREGFQIQFSPCGKFRTGRAIFFRPTPKFFADRFTEVGCGGEVEVAWPFGEDGCQERCRAAGTTRTPRASTYSASTTFGRNPVPVLPFKCSATLFPEHTSRNTSALPLRHRLYLFDIGSTS